MLKFNGPLYLVENIGVSRRFYEGFLGQKVKLDFGVNVSFEGDFAIQLKSHYQSLLGDSTRYPVTIKALNGELYFETNEIEAIYQRLLNTGVEFLHEIREQLWAQRVLRFYDPDGHIVEIGEWMETVVLRLYYQGRSIDQIRDKTAMPREHIEQVIRKNDTLAVNASDT